MGSANYPRPSKEMTEMEKACWRLYSRIIISNETGCWVWQGGKVSNGYAKLTHVTLYDETKRDVYGHRLSWAIKNGRWPVGKEVVMHSCDNPPCVNPEHLQLGVQKQNVDTRHRSGRWTGMNVGKLSQEQVLSIRASNLGQKELAVQYGVSQTAISHVRSGKTYRDNGRVVKPNTQLGQHTRWHLNRGVYNPNCPFCTI